MKRWMKGILIVALGFILVGGVATGICLGLGASWSDVTIIAGNRRGAGESADGAGSIGGEKTWDFEGQTIRSVELEIGASQVIWQEGDHFHVELEGNGPDIDCGVRDGVLKIEADESWSFGDWIFNWRIDTDGIYSEHQTITITVPRDAELRKADISIGAGSLEADFISADEVEIEVDVGSVQINGGRAEESLRVEVGVGSAELREFEAGPAHLSADTGSIDYGGSIRGNLDAQCDLGNVTLFLTGAERDYNYTLECDLGNITVDGREYSGLPNSLRLDNSAPYTVKLDCDLGSIELTFTR